MEPAIRLCKYDSKPINLSVGRRDRQFCNEICKNRYHNEQAYKEKQEIKRIENILKRNRRILKRLMGKKIEVEVSKEKLLKSGFEFDYQTHFKISKIRQNKFIFCFDYGYRNVSNDLFKIVKAFEYKED